MHLRTSLLMAKLRIARFLNVSFAVYMLFFCSKLVSELTLSLLGIPLGFVVWGVALIVLLKKISTNSDTSEYMSGQNSQFMDINELEVHLRQTSDPAEVIKIKRFLLAVKDVGSRAIKANMPGIFVSLPSPSSGPTDDNQEKALKIYQAGHGAGKAINVSYESITADDVSQDKISYVVAHELGHSEASSIMHITFANSLSQAAHITLRIFLVSSLVGGIIGGVWATFWTILGLFLVDNLLSNLAQRYEEYYADSYAFSLGFYEGGASFFQYLQENNIGVFPSVLEIFTTHPTHTNRLSNLNALHHNHQGLIPDALEKFLYTVLALVGGYYLVNSATSGLMLLTAVVYLTSVGSFIGLQSTDLLPRSKYHLVLRTVNLLLSCLSLYLVLGTFSIPGWMYWIGIGINAFVFIESIFDHKIDSLEILAGYAETALLSAMILVLLHTTGLLFLIPLL